MNKEFILYEQALALKELDFNESCLGYWKSKNWLIQEKTRTDGYTHADQKCSAPLYQQAFRWLYQKLDIEKGVMPLDSEPQQLLLKELIDKVELRIS